MTKTRAKITNASQAACLMQKGSKLTKTYNKTGTGWRLEPGGEISSKVAAKLLKLPHVQPNGDGFFPDTSQTFRLASAS